MILTISDVASVADSLSHWELGEYISEGFVVVACAGELVADFGRQSLTRAHRDHLERLATILLVAALLASLICLERANVLSGILIGSIRDKAVEASTKTEKALSDSTMALTQSGQAKEKASIAEGTSGRAKSEADAASLKAQQVDAELAQAEYLMSARSVENRDELANKLKQRFKGRDIALMSYRGDQEGWGLCAQLAFVAKSAEMKVFNQCGVEDFAIPGPGLENQPAVISAMAISGPNVQETLDIADMLVKIGRVPFGTTSGLPNGMLMIFVGIKPSFMIGQARGVKAPKKKNANMQSAKP